ncbi:MAG: hypothetical protein ACYDDE_00555 [bacterium]
MAGYNYKLGISNNAVTAYKSGLLPATKIKGIPSKLIKEFCAAEEWHHTNTKFFNETYFYNPEYVLATFGKIKHQEYMANKEAIQSLKEYNKNPKKKEIKIFENCFVEWLEWSGSKKHPKCDKKIAENCKVTIKGVTATIETSDKKVFTKRIATKGFEFYR